MSAGQPNPGRSDPGGTDPLHVLRSYGKWFLRARPADYLLAMSAAPASLPVIGRHVAPIGGMAIGLFLGCVVPGRVASPVVARV